MKVEFYFDPACPWCWITSRWLLVVSDHRDIEIDWRPFSLALKNDELGDTENQSKYAIGHRESHRIIRVIMAAVQKHNISPLEAYSAFGIPYHTAGFKYDDDLIADVIQQKSWDQSLVAAADEKSYDAAIQQSMQGAIDIAGDDIGVPTIVFANADGSKQGYFGPVLSQLPSDEESLAIWDGLSKLATVSSFYELKRSRGGTPPDTASTARCV